jgi:hypothetical protein
MSDSTDFTIVIVLLFGFIFYVYYLRKIIDALYDINNIKCNPVNLFLKSINAEPSESINNFAECVQLLGSPNDTPTPVANTDANNSSNSSSSAEQAADEIASANFEIF